MTPTCSSLGQANAAPADPECPFSGEALAAMATAGDRLPGMDDVRAGVFPPDRIGQAMRSPLQLAELCAGYTIDRYYTMDALAADLTLDANRRHHEILVAFRSADDDSAAFALLVSGLRSMEASRSDAVEPRHYPDAPLIGDEGVVWGDADVQTLSRGGVRGVEIWQERVYILFRRGAAVALTSDRFGGGRVDLPLAISLAVELDARLAAKH